MTASMGRRTGGGRARAVAAISWLVLLLAWPSWPLQHRPEARAEEPAPAASNVEFLRGLYALLDRGEVARAESSAVARIATSAWASHEDSLHHSDLLGLVLEARFASGRTSDSTVLPMAESLVSLREKLLDASHPDLATSLEYLGLLERERNRLGAAEQHLAGALRIRTRAPEPNAPDVVRCMAQLAPVLIATGRPAAAESLLVVALRRLGGSGAGMNPLEVQVRFHLAQARAALEDTTGVRSGFRDAIDAWGVPSNPVRLAVALHASGSWEMLRGNLSEAETLLDRALSLRRSLRPVSPDLPATLRDRARLHLLLGEPGRAQERLDEAESLSGRSAGPGSRESELLRGESLARLGRYEESLPHYARAGDLASARTTRDSADAASALQPAAVAESRLGRHRAADSLMRASLAIRRRLLGDEHPETVRSLLGLADLARGRADLDSALAFGERAVSVLERRSRPNDSRLADALIGLANSVRATGDVARSRALIERSLALLAGEGAGESLRYAEALGHFGLLLKDLGRLDEALDTLGRARSILVARLGGERSEVAAILNSMGTVQRRAGRLEAADSLYSRALGIWNRVAGEEHPETLPALRNLGNLALQRGDPVGARSRFERALAISKRVRGNLHPDVAACMLGMGNAAKVSRDFAGAAAWYRGAIDIQSSVMGPEHPSLGPPLHNLAVVLLETGRLAAAFDTALVLEDMTRRQFELVAATLTEDEALAYAAARPSGLDVALTCALSLGDPDRIWKAWDVQARSRGLVLDEMASRRRAMRQAGDRALAPYVEALARTSRELSTLTVLGPSDVSGDYRRALESARLRKDQAERALAEKSGEYRLRGSGRAGSVRSLPALLPEKSAVVAFVRYRRLERRREAGASRASEREGVPSYAALGVRARGTHAWMLDLGPADAIDSLVSKWQSESSQDPLRLRDPETAWASYLRLSEALRAAIWDSAGVRVEGAERVFVIPDGSLHLLNLAALASAPGKFLIETGPLLQQVSAERDLWAPSSGASTAEGLLVAASPDYDAATARSGNAGETEPSRSPCEAFGSLEFRPLPGTMSEQRRIVELWNRFQERLPGSKPVERSPARALTGGDATEEAFKAGAPGSRILHLATHGFFLGEDCGATPVAAVPDDWSEGGADRGPGTNPLLLSGLALAGANRRSWERGREDGILTAEEISSLDLDGVDWAVLSACETGLGELRVGEGVFGLRRAFQLAGARTIIMTLWSVRDDVARAWMESLYDTRLRKRASTAESVREASLQLLKSCRMQKIQPFPFYWGAFIASGAFE